MWVSSSLKSAFKNIIRITWVFTCKHGWLSRLHMDTPPQTLHAWNVGYLNYRRRIDPPNPNSGWGLHWDQPPILGTLQSSQAEGGPQTQAWFCRRGWGGLQEDISETRAAVGGYNAESGSVTDEGSFLKTNRFVAMTTDSHRDSRFHLPPPERSTPPQKCFWHIYWHCKETRTN